MTRFLSKALQAEEPYFRQGLNNLELNNGRPNHDIRLTAETIQKTKFKIQQLGLNPTIASPQEIYEALSHKMYLDDLHLTKKLRTLAARHSTADADVIIGMIIAIRSLPETRHTFAVKPSAIKSLMKNALPKKTIKQFGYRSDASFLKHEKPVDMLAAAWLLEGQAWQKKFTDSYKKLKPSDFEDRHIKIQYMRDKNWQKIADNVVSDYRHNILTLKEAGALIVLPVKNKPNAGFTTASLCLLLHELNAIRAASTFLKMNVVRSDFGQLVAELIEEEPRLETKLLDQPLPWQLVHRYYASAKDKFKQELFEPHLTNSDLIWEPIENSLAKIDDNMVFWKGSSALGLAENRALSFNVIDVAANLCNSLPYHDSVASFFQKNLWHELMMRYMQHEPVENSLLSNLQPQYAEERALA